MKRRSFIKIFTGIGLAILGSITLIPTFEETIMEIIKDGTNQLPIKSNYYLIFIQEADKEKYWTRYSFFKKEFIRLHYLLDNTMFPLPYFNKYRQYKDQIIGQFLLSTDFFLNKMDVKRKIIYLGFYNPYKNPCSMPFSNNFYNI